MPRDQMSVTLSSSQPVSNHYCEECLSLDRVLGEVQENDTDTRDMQRTVRLKSFGTTTLNASCSACEDIARIFADSSCNYDHVDLQIFRTKTSAKSVQLRLCLWMGGHRSVNDKLYLLKRPIYSARPLLQLHESDSQTNLDIGSIKQWLATCDQTHALCQRNRDPAQAGALNLVDVVDECVTSTFLGAVQYTALSYVWGQSRVTKLAQHTASGLREPGSLSRTSNGAVIPRTIRDAMRLTADLGLRYLWVDCLCIAQDDPHIDNLLGQMSVIYANAHLTFIVADQDNADGGIHAYERGPENRNLPSESIGYPNHVLGIERNRGSIAHSPQERVPWATRAWTLQEGFFSHRALIFDGLMSWVCATDYSVEGIDCGHTTEGLVLGRYGDIRNICASTGRKPSSLNNPVERKWSSFQQLQKAFMDRRLSYETDVMRAFAGISSYFANSAGLQHDGDVPTMIFFGHPLAFLARSLLWKSPDATLRRRTLPARADGLPLIPSWSWFASQGSIVFPHRMTHTVKEGSFDLDVPTKIELRCYHCQRLFSSDGSCCNSRNRSRVWDSPESDQYLYMGAQQANFCVQCLKEIKNKWTIIQDGEGQTDLGQIHFDALPLDRKNQVDGKPMDFRFIGICWCSDLEGAYVRALCVRDATDRPGVVERIGAARIRKDVWDRQATVQSQIVLG
ncbi:hypothetical protein NX059_005104 [Plenodomus lindquistii]|nr:hypothetical protein NX059_005104 [Plenodomus lindquistii]